MKTFAEDLSELFYKYGCIKSSQIDDVAYSIQMAAVRIIGIIMVVIIGMSTNNLVGSLLFYLLFAFLRKYSGGFHCNSVIGCTFLSAITIGLISALQFSLSKKNDILLVGLCLSAVIVLFIGAINNNSIAWSDKEYMIAKTISKIRCCISLLLTVVFYFFMNSSVFLYCTTMAMSVNAISLLISYHRK